MRRAALLLTVLLAACAAPVWQYDLRGQTLGCDQANEAVYHTLRVMGFTVTAIEPALVGKPGFVRGTRERDGQQNVRVDVSCDGHSADIVAAEESRLLNLTEFKRSFFLAFGAAASARADDRAAAAAEAAAPLEQKHKKGLRVLLQPVPGPGSKLDLGIDLSTANVLPVKLTITNATSRSYAFDPSAVVMLLKGGARVAPLTVADAASKAVASAIGASTDGDTVAPSADTLREALASRSLRVTQVLANQTVEGFLYFPLGEYVRGRVTFEDSSNGETEGFFIEF